VGIVTVSPVVAATGGDNISWGFELEVQVDSIGISLIGEKPHSEVFAAELRGLYLKNDLTSTGRRAMQFLVHRLYLDLMRPSPVVVLSSLSQESRPFLQLDMILEDVFARDMTINKVDLCLTPLEVTADDTLIQEAKKYVKCVGQWVIPKNEQLGQARSKSRDFGGEQLQTLGAFLSQGPPPVYMGWGSMMAKSESHMTCLAVRSLMHAKMRGIILGGWAGLKPELLEGQKDEAEMKSYCSGNVLFLETAPHEYLFPKCSVIVHHGGIGTTHASLGAGLPTIVTPVFF